MRYDNKTKENIRQLRRLGFSLDQISSKTGIPRTTVHLWIREIKLSEKQSEQLKEHVHNALQKGRVKREKLQLRARLKNERERFLKGKDDIGNLSQRELFLSGVALYWAEGFKNKHEHRLGFCNSDPEMVRFYIKWLIKVIKVETKDVVLRVTINESHKDRIKEIESFWSEKTGISLAQFTAPFFQKTKWKKQYPNREYYGVLRLHVNGSLNYILRMRGWIEGMKINVIK